MTILSADQRELLLPLVEGIHESPPWRAFLRNLVARTYARRAFLIVTLANAHPADDPYVVHVAAPRAAQEPPIDFRRMDALGLHPYGAMRPGRIYALDEILDYDDRSKLARQQAELEEMRIRFGRFLRVSAGGVADAWLLLVREQEDFSASAVSTLAMIEPHLAVALRTLVALIEQRLQTAMAQSALERLGAGQIAFDASGRIMAADPQAERMLSWTRDMGAGGRRLQLLPDVARALDAHCAELASDAQAGSRALLLDERRGLWLLLRKAALSLAEPRAAPAAIGMLRLDRREDAQGAVRTIAAMHGLSQREAELAHALTLGESIAEAGERLGLTRETARNYSKRIYAKTGALGQADLVRIVLTGLAPFS
ncbi:MAG: hypothetical protein RIS94_1120 [Pseudomonadota bacterium]|jgi:DNA-binding CsgD family transcriptional regulator/PAS domain-containing protein